MPPRGPGPGSRNASAVRSPDVRGRRPLQPPTSSRRQGPGREKSACMRGVYEYVLRVQRRDTQYRTGEGPRRPRGSQITADSRQAAACACPDTRRQDGTSVFGIVDSHKVAHRRGLLRGARQHIASISLRGSRVPLYYPLISPASRWHLADISPASRQHLASVSPSIASRGLSMRSRRGSSGQVRVRVRVRVRAR
eukprot:scaffold30437_cov54-Phaeocystis_antarctica.AAC.1